MLDRIKFAGLILIMATFPCFGRDNGKVDVQRLANAIYEAEGGARTSHPYGILTHYNKTTPRQACINTIKHGLRDWNGKGDFISFLGSRYCPTKGKNLRPAEKRLNPNWIANVRKFYNKGK
jgi:hypothetical protein